MYEDSVESIRIGERLAGNLSLQPLIDVFPLYPEEADAPEEEFSFAS